MKRILVWDLATRLFHWALVIAVALSAWSAFEDKFGVWAKVHLYSGLTVIGLVLWRIVWGLVGSETARFRHFVKGPRAVIAHLKGKGTDEAVGHNPAGGWSVVLLLALALLQAGLGLFATDDMFFSGPLSAKAGSNAGLITEIHEITGFTLFGVIGLHVAAILYYRIVRKIDLTGPMVTGRKNVADETKEPATGRGLLAILTALAVGGGVAYWLL